VGVQRECTFRALQHAHALYRVPVLRCKPRGRARCKLVGSAWVFPGAIPGAPPRGRRAGMGEPVATPRPPGELQATPRVRRRRCQVLPLALDDIVRSRSLTLLRRQSSRR
jgi:hypothetical protein